LYTYRSFTSPEQLWQKLAERYRVPDSVDPKIKEGTVLLLPFGPVAVRVVVVGTIGWIVGGRLTVWFGFGT
jgi:hypothetical protein